MRPVTRICTICARGGSKGVPGKNIRPLLGKPLILWTIEQARACSLFDLVAVSSDSVEILEIAAQAGADLCVNRPPEMATHQAGKLPAIAHCAREAEAALGRKCDVLADLDATAPLRIDEDIRGAVHLLEQSGASNVLTAMPARRSPYFNIIELDASGVAHLSKQVDTPVLSRQASPVCYDLNGAVYVWRRDAFFNGPAIFYSDTRMFEMPEERAIDIDTELDFEYVELLMMRRSGRGE